MPIAARPSSSHTTNSTSPQASVPPIPLGRTTPTGSRAPRRHPDWQPAGGLLGGAIRFPGSGTHANYFSVASFAEINGSPAGMTIATWFKPAGASGYRGIVMSREVVGSAPFGFGHDGDHLDGRVDGVRHRFTGRLAH